MRGDIRRRASRTSAVEAGDERDVELAALDAVERREPLRDQVLVRGELIVGQRFPVGEEAHPQRRREPADLLDQPLRVLRAGAHDGEGFFLPRRAAPGRANPRTSETGVPLTGGKRIAMHQCKKRVIISP